MYLVAEKSTLQNYYIILRTLTKNARGKRRKLYRKELVRKVNLVKVMAWTENIKEAIVLFLMKPLEIMRFIKKRFNRKLYTHCVQVEYERRKYAQKSFLIKVLIDAKSLMFEVDDVTVYTLHIASL